ncbi:MAG: Mut7-C RNAse domain-containing protein [Endomicrobiia bacterium]
MTQKIEEPKFLVDFMLGRLAKWLRIWGFDADYYRDTNREGILLKSLQDKKIILTKDHTLSKKRAWKLVLIKSDFLNEQLQQVKKDFNLEFNKERLFSRCSICNVPIKEIEKEKVKDKVPPFVYANYDEFSYCPVCQRVYWQGTHFDLINEQLKNKKSP